MKEFVAKHNLKGEVVAAGVSGGADSLALVLGLKEAGCIPVALTVDHGLRKESAKEAAYVAQVMQANGIEHHVLCWQGDKPITGVEEAARKERYRLMFEFCHRRGIKYLATGHHMRDQAETFLLRLARGSGVFGLSGILPVSRREEITIIRPQLDKKPEELKDFLRQKNISWVEDPMNNSNDFMRVKVRKFLPKLADIGIDERRLAETAATLAKTRAFVEGEVESFIKNNVRDFDEAAAGLSLAKLKELHHEIALPLLGILIRKIGGGDYRPEAKEVERVLAVDDNFRGCTLGGCEIFVAAKRLWIVPQDNDNRVMKRQDWDNFEKQNPKYRNCGLPYKVRRAIYNKLKE